MCDLCNEILKVGSVEWKTKFPTFSDEKDCLVKTIDGYKIYVPDIDYAFYLGIKVNYCPTCGRKLRRDNNDPNL